MDQSLVPVVIATLAAAVIVVALLFFERVRAVVRDGKRSLTLVATGRRKSSGATGRVAIDRLKAQRGIDARADSSIEGHDWETEGTAKIEAGRPASEPRAVPKDRR